MVILCSTLCKCVWETDSKISHCDVNELAELTTYPQNMYISLLLNKPFKIFFSTTFQTKCCSLIVYVTRNSMQCWAFFVFWCVRSRIEYNRTKASVHIYDPVTHVNSILTSHTYVKLRDSECVSLLLPWRCFFCFLSNEWRSRHASGIMDGRMDFSSSENRKLYNRSSVHIQIP